MRRVKIVGMVVGLAFAVMGCFSQNTGVTGANDTSNIKEGKTLSKRALYTSNYSTMCIRGTFNGWLPGAMTLIANNTWKATVTFGSTATERFKFDVNGDWVTNWGDNNGDKTADSNGADIPVTAGKAYTITFNDSSKAYTVVEETSTVYVYPKIKALNFTTTPGINSMVRTLKVDLYKNNMYIKSSVIDGTSILSATFYNLEKGGSYTIKLPTQIKNETDVTLPVTGNVKYTGADYGILTPSDGTALAPVEYTVNAESINYAKAYPTMYFRGTPNAWGTTLMEQVGDNTWATKVTFGTTTTERFKFDALGNWALSTNWGDNLVNGVRDGIADAAGSDIPVAASSAYTIVFNDTTKKYTMVPAVASSVTLAQDRFIISKGDTTFVLPPSVTTMQSGYLITQSITWSPALDVNKVGTTVYTSSQFGLIYYLTVR